MSLLMKVGPGIRILEVSPRMAVAVSRNIVKPRVRLNVVKCVCHRLLCLEISRFRCIRLTRVLKEALAMRRDMTFCEFYSEITISAARPVGYTYRY